MVAKQQNGPEPRPTGSGDDTPERRAARTEVVDAHVGILSGTFDHGELDMFREEWGEGRRDPS